jgi:protocatechuate 3,4-dioxygenase beta subunit
MQIKPSNLPVLFSYLTMMCIFLFITGCAYGQQQMPDRNVGGPCEGCEALYEYGDQFLNSQITMPGYDSAAQKLIVNGTVFQSDGKTPAKGVILYFYQTNSNGLYTARDHATGWERRHGALRGWVKTGDDGSYKIMTNMPASYPDRTEPAHIHITVKEKGLIPYYIDAILFEDDTLLTQEHKDGLKKRGGSGIVALNSGPILKGKRDIILGLNIPDY